MKKLIMACLLTMMAVPAFATEEVAAELDPTYRVEVDVPGIPGRPTRERWICYARNDFGETFYGTNANMTRAERMALRACERESFGFCRIVGCDRR